ncbi:3-oxoacyl-ACP synthase [Subtercola boreus]|uniref:3-oxoacyl-ACP synthase n=1 Tax=Subtercola boreus TaxID=120213 RepID=A0A3E0W4M0_9MICO|nr:beta-ketoacyl-ACP synthase III [Subtercola boreus]RFA16087.1 3-oxoacyl-ACP synthase [Subtercola boreus]
MSTAQIVPAPTSPGARIAGFGFDRGSRIVTNDDLSQTFDTNDEWITRRVGIRERRFATADETVVSMAVTAGRMALEDAGMLPADIDTVIVATCTMPSQIPHAATQVAAGLGIEAPGSFDLNAACAGFCYGLGVASSAIKNGAARNVLLIGAEKLTDWVDQTDRGNAIIFGDGAGAVVVTASEVDEIGRVAWGSAEKLVSTIHIKDRDSFIFQEGQSVFRWASTAIAPVALRAVDASGVALGDIDALVTHQANLRIVEAIAHKVKDAGARDDLIVADDIVTTGNTSSASIPIAIARMREAGTLKSGDLVLSVGFGAGLTYAGIVFRLP